MAYLVDTNILLRLVTTSDPLHASVLEAVHHLEASGEALFSTGQNFIEFWNVATRPEGKNGWGQSPAAAAEILTGLESSFPRLTESPEVYDIWRDLVVRFSVSGVNVHDTRLVAVMLANGVQNILTFNTRDFRRFAEVGIVVVSPKST